MQREGTMAIVGAHALLYTSEPEKLRALLAKGVEVTGEPQDEATASP
jgi:hypothetical protein